MKDAFRPRLGKLEAELEEAGLSATELPIYGGLKGRFPPEGSLIRSNLSIPTMRVYDNMNVLNFSFFKILIFPQIYSQDEKLTTALNMSGVAACPSGCGCFSDQKIHWTKAMLARCFEDLSKPLPEPRFVKNNLD